MEIDSRLVVIHLNNVFRFNQSHLAASIVYGTDD